MRFRRLSNSSGAVTIPVLAVIGLIAIVTYVVSDQVSFTHRLTKDARARASLEVSEAKLRSVLEQPLSFFNCSPEGVCDFDYRLINNLDPSGDVIALPTMTEKTWDDFANGRTQFELSVSDTEELAQIFEIAIRPYWWCETQPDGTKKRIRLGYNNGRFLLPRDNEFAPPDFESDSEPGTFTGVLIFWDKNAFLTAQKPGMSSLTEESAKEILLGFINTQMGTRPDCGGLSILDKIMANMGIPKNAIKDRVVRVKLPPNPARPSAAWSCPDTAPVFRGFDEKGLPRCEPFYLWSAQLGQDSTKCPSGHYSAGMDDDTLQFACTSINKPLMCGMDGYIKSLSWAGGGTAPSGVACEPRKDPWNYFKFQPKVVTGGPIVMPPERLPASPPTTAPVVDPRPTFCFPEKPWQCGDGICETSKGEQNSWWCWDCKAVPKCGNGTCDVTDGETATNCPADCPSTLCQNSNVCSCWGQIMAKRGKGECLDGSSNTNFACSNSAETIYQCQQCLDAGKNKIWRTVAVRECSTSSGYQTLSGVGNACTGTEPNLPRHHFCCSGKVSGNTVLDGDNLCCQGANTVKKWYECKDTNGDGALELADPQPGSAEYLDNLSFPQDPDYVATKCQ